MRLDDPRLLAGGGPAGPAGRPGLSAIVSFVEESADHRLFIAVALLEDGRIRHVQRKLFLPTYGLFDERRFFAAGDLLRATPSQPGRGRRAERLRGLLAPRRAPAAGPRRGPDPGQRLVLAGPRPGRPQRGRPGHGDLVADAPADVCPAHDELRRLRQPGRGRRVDLVLGRLGGDRAERRRDLQRAALRRGPVPRRRRPGRRPPGADRAAPAARRAPRAGRPRARPDRRRAGRPGRRLDRRGGRRGRASTWPPDERRRRAADRARRRGPVRPAARAGDRHRRRPPGDRRVHPRPAPPGRLRAGRGRACRAGSTRRSSPTSSPRRSAPSGCSA